MSGVRLESGLVTTNGTVMEEPVDRISNTATTLACILCLGVAANVVAAPVILFRRTR